MKKLFAAFLAVFMLCESSYALDFGVRIMNTSLSDATEGEYYVHTFSASGGGTAGLSWSMSGIIPGLSFMSGTLSGRPSTPGRYSFTITAERRYSTGYTPASDSANCTLVVKAKSEGGEGGGGGSNPSDDNTIAPSITGSIFDFNTGREYVMENHLYGNIYSYLTVENGTPPYKWKVSKGEIPRGTALYPSDEAEHIVNRNENCRYLYINGVPVEAGDYNFTIQVTDAQGRTAEKEFSGKVNGDNFDSELTIESWLDNGGTVLPSPNYYGFWDRFLHYEQLFAEVKPSVRPPYTWQIISGTLPTGLRLSPSNSVYANYGETGRYAHVRGTAEGKGAFKFIVKVTDADGRSAKREFSINVEGGSDNDPAANGDAVLTIDTDPVITGAFADGEDGKEYSSYVTASEGTPPYTWEVITLNTANDEEKFPTGLLLTCSDSEASPGTGTIGRYAHITGTPEYKLWGGGYHTFALKVTDSKGNTNAKTFTMKIAEPTQQQTPEPGPVDPDPDPDPDPEPNPTPEYPESPTPTPPAPNPDSPDIKAESASSSSGGGCNSSVSILGFMLAVIAFRKR